MLLYESSNELYHYGVLGMKWGVRRTPTQLGHPTTSKKKSSSKGLISFKKQKKSTPNKSSKTQSKQDSPRKKKTISEMSDDELRKSINRMQMEKQYKILIADSRQKTKMQKASKFIGSVIENSGRQVATQVATYYMGKAVNKAIGDNVVNIKKDKKDK